MIPPRDQYGPWLPGLDEAERRARLHSMRTAVHVHLGPRGALLSELLRPAEGDTTALEPAAVALNRLASIDRRHVLATFATIHRVA